MKCKKTFDKRIKNSRLKKLIELNIKFGLQNKCVYNLTVTKTKTIRTVFHEIEVSLVKFKIWIRPQPSHKKKLIIIIENNIALYF